MAAVHRNLFDQTGLVNASVVNKGSASEDQ